MVLTRNRDRSDGQVSWLPALVVSAGYSSATARDSHPIPYAPRSARHPSALSIRLCILLLHLQVPSFQTNPDLRPSEASGRLGKDGTDWVRILLEAGPPMDHDGGLGKCTAKSNSTCQARCSGNLTHNRRICLRRSDIPWG